MTLNELIEMAQDLVAQNPEMGEQEVFHSYNYGDYSRTEALVRTHSIGMRHVYDSAYSPTEIAVGWNDQTNGKKLVLRPYRQGEDDNEIYDIEPAQPYDDGEEF